MDHPVAAANSPRTIAGPATEGPGAALYFVSKRGIDLGGAALLLLLLAPLLLLIAVLIKLDSPGPAIFVQERVGARRRTGRGAARWEIYPFRLYKFRSMVQNADPAPHAAFIAAFAAGTVAPGRGAARFKLTADPRVTRVGHLLRRTSLDELPQLLNVLKGEMSLVGPRPVPPYEVACYQPWQFERLAAQPGITGLWQVRGRSQLAFDAMIRLDIDYVRHRSLWLDLKLLALTIPAVLSTRGAA